MALGPQIALMATNATARTKLRAAATAFHFSMKLVEEVFPVVNASSTTLPMQASRFVT
jgi:hypothetical protein